MHSSFLTPQILLSRCIDGSSHLHHKKYLVFKQPPLVDIVQSTPTLDDSFVSRIIFCQAIGILFVHWEIFWPEYIWNRQIGVEVKTIAMDHRL